MAKVVRIGRKLARLGGKLVLDTNGAPCCCGGEACGGHGEGCCDCGTFYFVDRPGVTFPASVSVTGAGTEVGVCSANPCGLSVVQQVGASSYDILTRTDGSCNLRHNTTGGSNHIIGFHNIRCLNESDSSVTNNFNLNRAWAGDPFSAGDCARYQIPPSTTLPRVYIGPALGFTRAASFANSVGGTGDVDRYICGPYLFINIIHWMDITPGDPVQMAFQVIAGRNAAYVQAAIRIRGNSFVCVDGQVVPPEDYPVEMPDGIVTVAGGLSSNGICDVSGQLQLEVPMACEQSGGACVRTELYRAAYDYQILADLRPVIAYCGGELGSGDPGDAGDPIIIGGGQGSGRLDPRVQAMLDLQARGGGCAGCGGGWTG